MNLLRSHPPDGVEYQSVGGFHAGSAGARCSIAWEVALNRIVRPRAVPDMGFRALRLRERFDVVHVHAHPIRLTRRSGVPLVMSEGSSNAVYLGGYLGWSDERIARRYRRSRRLYRAIGVYDRLLALDRVARAYVFSDWAREVNIRWGADPGKLEVIPPGFVTPELAPTNESDTFTFLFVGTDFERKGGFDVVEAFDQVRRDLNNVRLILAGSRPSEKNPDRLLHSWVGDERRARILAKLDNLEQIGLVEQYPLVKADEVRSLYGRAQAFVMPTLAEGFGFTNVEAMSFGLPVISSQTGPIPETVAHGETGTLVAPGDVAALAKAMSRLAADPQAARRMGVAGRESFLARFTLERFQQSLGDFYRRAAESA
jgi:glycosyltransferase involved in cell wall biosynthesis